MSYPVCTMQSETMMMLQQENSVITDPLSSIVQAPGIIQVAIVVRQIHL